MRNILQHACTNTAAMFVLSAANGNYSTFETRQTADSDSPPRTLSRTSRKSCANFIEYASVKRAFENYIDNFVGAGDVIVVDERSAEHGPARRTVSSVAARTRFTGCRIITRS